VAGGVGQHQQQALGQQRGVVGVAARGRGRHEAAMQLVARAGGHRGGQRGALQLAGQRELVLQPLGGQQLFGHARPRQGRGAGRGQRGGQLHVGAVEGAAHAVEHLQHADQRAAAVEQGQRQDRAGAKPARPVDLGVEARVGVGVGDLDHLVRGGAVADDAAAPAHVDGRKILRHLQAEAARGLVDQPHRGAFGLQHGAGGQRHAFEQGLQRQWLCQRACGVEQGAQRRGWQCGQVGRGRVHAAIVAPRAGRL
jgi:hypothetical protein